MELHVAERRAVELLRSRLEPGLITVLNAKLQEQDTITVDGLFEDLKGNRRRFEVNFQIKNGQAKVVNWFVSS